MEKTENQSKNVTVVKSHRKANIAVIVIASVAVAILITIAVLCAVRVDPMRDVEKPAYYVFYDLGSSEAEPTNSETQSSISAAMDGMSFGIMSAILQGRWDYSYNFKRNSSDEKVELTADEVSKIANSTSEYMVELVYAPVTITDDGRIDYSTAQSLKVDGETVYFDRLKVMIGDTNGGVGSISLYPYIDARIGRNETDNPELSSATYKVTGINVRADTTKTFAALKELATQISRG